MADNGTLFLDEIGELSPALQAKLLRVLQYGDIQRIGDDRPLRVNVRVLAATNRDLRAEVAAGHFRADLFHRLSIFPLQVPPLRERHEDILLLTGYFCERYRQTFGLPQVVISPALRQTVQISGINPETAGRRCPAAVTAGKGGADKLRLKSIGSRAQILIGLCRMCFWADNRFRDFFRREVMRL